MSEQQQPKDPADVLFICSLEDLNCLHDYMVAAMAGDDLSELPRLWNQQIGVIRSRPHPAPDIFVETRSKDPDFIRNGRCGVFKAWLPKHDAVIARKAREDVLKELRHLIEYNGDLFQYVGTSVLPEKVVAYRFLLDEGIESLRSTQQQAGDQHE